MIDIKATATIGGKKTNRVKVKRKSMSAGTARRYYRQDPTVRGLQTAVTCISLPVEELEAIDAACARSQMARSHFLRQAAKRFAEYLANGQQARMRRGEK